MTNTSADNHAFNRTDWAAAGLVTLIALTIYSASLAPTVTLGQSGALAVAGQYLGIGRVPGYPLWHLLAKGFITVFGFVRYRGYPNPAWATNFMSAFYAYLPLASEANPPMQFGYARVWVGFAHVITRGQYERIIPTDVLSLRFLEQLRWYVGLLGRQYVFPLSLAALLPLVRVSRFRGPWLRLWCTCILALFMFSVILVIGANPKGDVQDSFIQMVKFIPSFAIWGVFSGLGFLMILDWISRLGDADLRGLRHIVRRK